MLVLCGIALMCALTAAADVTTQPAMDVTQLLQQLQTEIQEFRGINIDGLTRKPSIFYSTTPQSNTIQSNSHYISFQCVHQYLLVKDHTTPF